MQNAAIMILMTTQIITIAVIGYMVVQQRKEK
jgi:hypothetical protein